MSDQQAPQAPQGPAINRVPTHYGQPPQMQHGNPNMQGGPPQMQPGYNGAPIQQQAVEEHWILNCGGAPEQHLGFLKETFKRGSVITHDLTNNRLIINGRVFYDVRDLDILKNQMHRNPQRPWVLPYSEEALQDIQDGYQPQPVQSPNQDPRDHSMPIVQDDSTTVAPIDIRHTKVAANNAQARNQHRQRVANEPLEVIRGDESVEERIKRLAGKNDPKSLAERERLKRQPWKPEIVRDDSLGMGTGRDIPLNAGVPLPSRETAAQASERAAAEAAARKREAEMRRGGYGVAPQAPQQQAPVHPQVAAVDPQLFDEVAPGFEQAAPAPQGPAQGIPNTAAPDARLDVLEGQVGNIAENMNNMMEMMTRMMQPPVADGIERTPVTDDATAQAVAEAQQEG